MAAPRAKQQNQLKTSGVNIALNSKRYRTLSISNENIYQTTALEKPATNRLAKQSWSWRITVEKATSNGNCLYNSASIILNGNEDLSLLLRLLTAVELYKNAPFYATHPNLPEAASDCCLPEISLFIQFLSDWGLKVIENTKDRNEAVKGEAIAGCRDKKLSEMIHMMALSTVIGRLIFPLYPECNKNTRPLCRKDILPRDYGTK